MKRLPVMPGALFLMVSVVVLGAPPPAAKSRLQVTGPSRAADPWSLLFSRGHDIWIADRHGGHQRLLARNGGAPAWAPGKRRFAFVRQGQVWLAWADGTGQKPLSSKADLVPSKPGNPDPHGQGREVDISWAPKGDRIAYSHWEGVSVTRPRTDWTARLECCSLFNIQVANGRAAKGLPWADIFDPEVPSAFSVNNHPAWSGSGKKFAWVRNGDIWVAELESSEPGNEEWSWTRALATGEYDGRTIGASRASTAPSHLGWAPGDRHLIYSNCRINGTGTESIEDLDLQTGKEVGVGVGVDPSLSPDGRWIAYQAIDGTGIHVMNRHGKQDHPLIRNASEVAW
jgi:hypothetical protein